MAKEITVDEMRAKLAAYCDAYPEYKMEEANGKFLINNGGSKPITISVENGKPKGDVDFLLKVMECGSSLAPLPR